MAGAPPHGEASDMDASTSGGASMVDAPLFFLKKFRSLLKNKQRRGGWGYDGGGAATVCRWCGGSVSVVRRQYWCDGGGAVVCSTSAQW